MKRTDQTVFKTGFSLNWSGQFGAKYNPLLLLLQGKGKAIPLQAWTGREGSRKSRLPDMKTIGTGRW